MCNYCQTGSVFSNSCGCNSQWRVQRICYDRNGNIHVIFSNGYTCRRITCGVRQNNSWWNEANTTATNGNGCSCGCANDTAETSGDSCFGSCARNATAQNTDSYYARLYGLYSGTNGRSCCCGGYTAL
ncbi:MAG: hypothetical protein IJ308_07120 [Clostridia bacterium]|nr:hypothetical protein [Clostridia bacterium]